MKTPDEYSVSMPPALLAEVQAAAQEEHRPADELVRDAVRRYLESRHHLDLSHTGTAGNPRAAIDRIRELRKGNTLPEGVTIRDLINEGRA